MAEVEVLFCSEAHKSDLRKADEELAELVNDVRLERTAVLEKCSVYFLLDLFHVVTVQQSTYI